MPHYSKTHDKLTQHCNTTLGWKQFKLPKRLKYPIRLPSNTARHYILSLSLGFLNLAVITFLFCSLFTKQEIINFPTENLTSTNLTLLTLIFALRTLPSYIRQNEYDKHFVQRRIEQEKYDNTVDNISLILTITLTTICAIFLSKAIQEVTQFNVYIAFKDTNYIINLFIFALCLYSVIFLPNQNHLEIKPFLDSLNKLNNLQSHSDRNSSRSDRYLLLVLILLVAIFLLYSTRHMTIIIIFIFLLLLAEYILSCYATIEKERMDTKYYLPEVLFKLIIFCYISAIPISTFVDNTSCRNFFYLAMFELLISLALFITRFRETQLSVLFTRHIRNKAIADLKSYINSQKSILESNLDSSAISQINNLIPSNLSHYRLKFDVITFPRIVVRNKGKYAN